MESSLGTVLDVGSMVRADAGIAGFVLFIGCAVFLWLYWLERKDRREAWKAHNELAKQTNEVIDKITLAIHLLAYQKGPSDVLGKKDL